MPIFEKHKIIHVKIVSYNLNGFRAAIKKGFIDWVAQENIDVICLQEIKATQDVVDVKLLEDLGYEHHWYSAQKKGYSGVAIFSKHEATEIKCGTGHEMSDFEGRVIQARIKDLIIISAYFPSGTAGDIRQTYKYQWLAEFEDHITQLKAYHQDIVICGDYNIAHTEIDIHDPKSNKNTTGFLPQERDWLTNFFAKGWVDSFRHINKEPHHYTWWSQRFPSVRLNNKGWRIDYISVSESLTSKIKDAGMVPDARHSDHCPIFVEIK